MLRKALPLVALLALAACSSSSQVPTTPAEPAPSAAPAAAAATAAATAAPAAPAAAPKIEPKTVEDCEAVAAVAASDDPSATGADATGASDRSAAITALMKQKRPGFRCCFDIWADKIPEVKLYNKVALTLAIDPAGKLKKATAAPEAGGPMVSKEVEGCLSAVSASLAYPPSSSGKDTTYTYHFDFKPKSRH